MPKVHFGTYHDALFENQTEWSGLSQDEARDWFINLAGDLGLDQEQFTSDLDNNVYAEYVAMLEEEAVNIGLPGTPATLVNGEVVAGQGSADRFHRLGQLYQLYYCRRVPDREAV